MHATDDIVKEFLIESYENLDRLDRELPQLEQPGESATRSSIFRTIHTIKGTCGFLGFGKLEAVSHVGESLLSRLRDGELTVTPQIVSGLLAMVDAIRKLLANIETTNAEGDDAFPQVIATLTRLKESEAVTTPTAAAAPAEMVAGRSVDRGSYHRGSRARNNGRVGSARLGSRRRHCGTTRRTCFPRRPRRPERCGGQLPCSRRAFRLHHPRGCLAARQTDEPRR